MSDDKPNPDFNVRQIIDKIDRCIASGDSLGALQEISRPWPGMDADLRIAVTALAAELARNGSAPLFAKDLKFDDQGQTVSIQFPDWFEAADQAFQKRYPDPQEASLRFQKTMAVLHGRLLPDEGEPPSGLAGLVEAVGEWLPPGWQPPPSARLH